MNNRKPILITGLHKYGSTLVGRVIGSTKMVRFVHEPFNHAKPRRNNSIVYWWFEYLDKNTLSMYHKKIIKYLKSFYSAFSLAN